MKKEVFWGIAFFIGFAYLLIEKRETVETVYIK